MKYLNKYTLLARYIPGFISLLPISLIYFFLTKNHTEYSLSEYFKSITFVLGISGTFVLSFFVSMVVREFGYFLEKKYFKNKSGFPSTYLMLYDDEKFPQQTKDLYGRKIYSDFSLSRLNEMAEQQNRNEALKILNQASRMLSTKYQQNDQLKDANIAYGFSRNTSGGLLIAIPSAFIGICYGYFLHEKSLILWSSLAAGIYISLAIFHKSWIKNNAEKYAEKLFSIYLG